MGRGNENLKSKQEINTSEGDERPFKKARHVWQIKGKYHLKETIKKAESSKAGESSKDSKIEYTDLSTNSESEVQVSNSSNRCNYKVHAPTDLITKAEKLMDNSDSSEDESVTQVAKKSKSYEVPVTLVEPNPKNQDYYLQKWQARQIARSFIDNTINRVLENWRVSPFDATDFVENCENDSLVEDKGILMAIKSHGLQSNIEDPFARSPLYKRSFDNPFETNVSNVERLNMSESDLENYQNTQNELLKTEANDEMSDPSSFLNTAVSFAIQKNGLTSRNAM